MQQHAAPDHLQKDASAGSWYMLPECYQAYHPDVENVALLVECPCGTRARGKVCDALGERLVVDIIPLGTELLR